MRRQFRAGFTVFARTPLRPPGEHNPERNLEALLDQACATLCHKGRLDGWGKVGFHGGTVAVHRPRMKDETIVLIRVRSA